MRLLFLGSGSAFTIGDDNYQSNMLLMSGAGKNLLIDCGSDVRLSLNKQGLSFNDISDVYISHLHADHVGGLEWLAFLTKFTPNCNKPKLHLHRLLEDELWENSLKAGLNTIDNEDVGLPYYFEVHTVSNPPNFNWQGVSFQLIKTCHIKRSNDFIPTYGLFFTIANKKIFITTDTRFDLDYFKYYYQQADIIFHDCETSATKSGVHAHYDELVTLDQSIKAKIWLYHYNPGPLPDAHKDGFCGIVKCGYYFDFD